MIAFTAAQLAAATGHPKIHIAFSKNAVKLFQLARTDLGGMEYPWLSDTSVLKLGSDGKLYRFDIPTKSKTRLDALTRQMQSSKAYIYFLTVSPTGRYVMWGESGANPIFGASIDGSRRWQWPNPDGMTSPYWSSDGEHIAQFAFSTSGFKNDTPIVHFNKVNVGSMADGKTSEAIADLPKGLQGLDVLSVVSTSQVIARVPDEIESVTPPLNTVPTIKHKRKKRNAPESNAYDISFMMKYKMRKTQELSIWDLHRQEPLRRWKVTLPGEVLSIAISPAGDKAAWLVSGVSKNKNATQEELWISNIDGTNMRKIGQGLGVRTIPSPMTITWSPSGKNLSYIAGGALWILPVR